MVEEVTPIEDEGRLLHRGVDAPRGRVGVRVRVRARVRVRRVHGGVDALEVEASELLPLGEHEHRVGTLHGHVPVTVRQGE